MTVYISYSFADKEIFDELAECLKQRGYIIYPRSGKYVHTHLISSIRKDISESDLFVALITEDYTDSKIALFELNIAVFTGKTGILPFISGSASVPVSVANIECEKTNSKEELVEKVVSCVTFLEDTEKHKNLPDDRNQHYWNQDCGNQKNRNRDNKNNAAGNSIEKKPQDGKSDDSSSDGRDNNRFLIGRNNTIRPETYDTENKIAALRKAFAHDRLTLVCGAGISSESSIPTWHDLLVNILNDIYSDHDPSNPDDMVSAEYLLSLMPESNLILGKYLRILLADDFEQVVQKHLYANYNQNRGMNSSTGQDLTCHDGETSILKAIVELARPGNNGRRLGSIITFNFDDLIEKALTNHDIDCASIWKDGQTCRHDQLPVFHVHGYLPNQEELDSPNLVFSEEAYHSQFNDPYSWANLTQLNAFSTNVCLFIGTSLSDPDLRRLLDIIWRRNHACKHYIIMKKNDQKSKTGEIANMLFEQDAYLLGLNVIWCSEFSEIPDILSRISGTTSQYDY